MQDNLISHFTPSCHALVSFSIGYFIYDALDMLIYHRYSLLTAMLRNSPPRKRSTYELLVHHFLVITCLGIAVSTRWLFTINANIKVTLVIRQYVGYGGLSLMVEVNSVFLHTRQLFVLTGESKGSLRYRINAILNIGKFGRPIHQA